ncbi:MAG: hypothetical protein EOO01_24260 [Chitinophagaceae bacterium]|nr:MAG: hypothetical protein EOO01_24260 [Chitinophagaceae bacterium]
MMQVFLHILYLACLLSSFIVALLNRNDLRSRRLFPFIPYLFLLFVQEILMFFYSIYAPHGSTGIYYNIYTPVNALFYVFFYTTIPFNSPVRRITWILASLFLAANLITYLFIQSIRVYNSYLGLAGGFLITLCGILFLFNYFKLDNPAEEKKWLPVLGITVGVVIFHPVVNISFALYKYLLAYQATISGMKLYRLIPQLMSIFMYGCFIRAFYLCKKKN